MLTDANSPLPKRVGAWVLVTDPKRLEGQSRHIGKCLTTTVAAFHFASIISEILLIFIITEFRKTLSQGKLTKLF